MSIVPQTINFLAEIRSVQSKKLISNDIEYTLRLCSSDSKIIDLAKLPADCVVDVHIEINNDK